MPALMKTDLTARIVWLGHVADTSRLRSSALDEMRLTFAGFEGEKHAGLTRPSCSRVVAQHPRGTTIRNVRQLSILSQEELDEIARDIDLDALDPALTGASVVVQGLPDFTHLPPSSRLQGPDGCTLVVDMENRPCNLPAREIHEAHAGHGAAFKAAARGRRGVTAWVEREGVLKLGDLLTLSVPDQPVWAHLDAMRRPSR